MIAKSLRCQGWAPCIIATIWLPEPLLEESLAGVEDELRERCARHPRFARLAVFSLRSAVTRRLLLSGKLVPRRITRFESRVHIVPGWNFGEAQPNNLERPGTYRNRRSVRRKPAPRR